MKKIVAYILFGAILFTFSVHTSGNSNHTSSISSNKLLEIIQVMKKREIDVDSWSLLTREQWGKLDQDELMSEYHQLKEKVEEVEWQVTENKEMWKAVGTIETNLGIKETFILVAHPHKNQFDTYLLYRANGLNWNNQQWSTFKPTYQSRVRSLFQEKYEIFTCVEGKQSDKIKGVLYKRADILLKDFEAKQIESLKEESFVSLSAYTGNWKNDIPAKNGAMNLQVALRRGLGGITTVTIGTPIITSEY